MKEKNWKNIVKHYLCTAGKSNVFPIILISCILIEAFLCVWQQARIINLGYEISQVKKQEEILINQNRSLELEQAKLIKNQNIERLAKDKFNLREPKEDQLVFILEDTSLTPLQLASND